MKKVLLILLPLTAAVSANCQQAFSDSAITGILPPHHISYSNFQTPPTTIS